MSGREKVTITDINISSLDVLKNKETIELISLYKETKDIAIRDKIIRGNMKLILSIIKKISVKNESSNDLFQVGCIGLIKAIENFSIDKNVQFSTYAYPMISGEIKRYLRDGGIIKISRQIKDVAYKCIRAKEEFVQLHKCEPNYEQIASMIEANYYQVKEAMESIQMISSIFDPLFNENGDSISLIDQIKDEGQDYRKELDIQTLKEGITKLDQSLQDIINRRYYIGLTQLEIADELGISQAQVSRMEKSALTQLKNMF